MKALGGGLVLLAGTTFLWWGVLAINVKVFPSVPWFVVVDLGVLYLAVRCLQRHDISLKRFGLISKQSIGFAASGMAACYCLAVVEGALADIQVGPLATLPGVSPLVSNAAVLLVPVYAAVSEELTFRGIVQCNLERVVNRHWAIAATTILYLAVHVQRSDFTAQWLFFLSLSVVLGIVAANFRSLALCIVLHATGNFISVFLTWRFGPFHLSQLTPAATLIIAVLGFVSAGLAVKILLASPVISPGEPLHR